MTEEENTRRWNEYFIPGTDVLKNKLGIIDATELKEKEVAISFFKNVELQENPIDLGFGVEHLRAIHQYLFSDIYPFAGQNRTVYMEKNNSYFAPVNEIDMRLQYTFDTMEEEIKDVYTKHDLAVFLATYYSELLHIHPFREGNGRSIREFIREYADGKSKDLPCGPMEFNWSNVDIDRVHEYIGLSLAFRSTIEMEFDKALVPIDKKQK